MEVVITSLDALLQKATNAALERPDPAALEAFCAVLGDSPNGAYIATRVIASRIKSPHPTEALLALEVLDACMKRCDSAFHSEVDKFRFLNEMIKLVSPKYYGNRTAPAVRQKVLTTMHAWTVDYPREIKIKDAYEMLKKQGVVKDAPPQVAEAASSNSTPSSTKSKNKDSFFQDEERSKMLQKLLQSKNPDDLQAANRLIKTMVREGERKIEAVTRRVTELQTIHNNARLLGEMLDHYRPSVSSQEDLDLIKELYSECSRLRPTIFKLAAETQQNEENLNEILEISDEMSRVFDKYSKTIVMGKPNETPPVNGAASSLLDLTVPTEPAVDKTNLPIVGPEFQTSHLEALGDIFSSSVKIDSPEMKDILQPLTLPSSSNVTEGKIEKPPLQKKNKGFEELNALGEELLKSSLPPSCKPNSQRLEKLSLNSIGKANADSPIENAKAQSSKEKAVAHSSRSDMLDLDFLISKTLKSAENASLQSPNDDAMVDISVDETLVDPKPKPIEENSEISLIEYIKTLKVKEEATPSNDKANGSHSPQPKSIETKNENKDVKSSVSCDIKLLNDISISIDSIKPSDRPPLTVYEESEGITVVFHHAKNTPRPDVTVLVISTTSRSSEPLTDFKFHAVVPKGCKVRLLRPSGDSFPLFSPFLPPAAITQVMLIARPRDDSFSQILLKYVISYNRADETVSEIGEVNSLQLNDM